MSDIKRVHGLWLPAHEKHLEGWIASRMKSHPEEVIGGRASYQYHKLTAALSFVRGFRTAVDVGAHCGLWSMFLAQRFSKLHAWEPISLHRKCFGLNVVEGDVTLHAAALGAEEGFCSMTTTQGSSGDSWVQASPSGEVPIEVLDSYNLRDVDFIKLDCEGYEFFALRGAEETLRRCRPVICVEQKPNRATRFGLGQKDALPWLESLGAKVRQEMSGDFILSWDKSVEEEVREEAASDFDKKMRGGFADPYLE